MPKRIWFTRDASDGINLAVINDDLYVEIDGLEAVAIYGWEGITIHLDFDDTADLARVLSEATELLRSRGLTPASKAGDPT